MSTGLRIHRVSRRRRAVLGLINGLVSTAMILSGLAVAPLVSAVQAPVGNGFTVTASDLAFILKQIKIAEHHAATYTAANPCGTLVGPGPHQIPDILTSYGLRTVDGSCNNLVPGREKFAAADVAFPRLSTPQFRAAEGVGADFFGPGSPAIPSSSYAQKKGFVFDSQPRVISNLIVDQTSTNPAAVAAAAFPVRTQGNPGLFPCTVDPDPTANPPVDGQPANCVPSHKTLFIPNVTTDVGLSPPYNSLFTFFGQFFDHGVDQTVKSGGTVFVPLRPDDPLITLGPDGKPNTGDEVPPGQQFMVLTRAQNQPGPDGVLGDRPPTDPNAGPCTSLNNPAGCDESADDIQNANNTDTPWVDQSQTYTSHSSHQVFLREYIDVAGRPQATGKLLGGLPAGQTYAGSPDGRDGISTWAAVKAQASSLLGLWLQDKDVTNIPMLAADPYGNFIPGPARGLPMYLTTGGTMIEGDRTANGGKGVAVPADAVYFDTPFLTDIAHNADPSPQDTDNNPATPPVAPVPDADNTPSADFAHQPAGTYDDEMLNAHFACGDGRCNENIALSTIHQIFHSEHDRLVDYYTNPVDGVLTRPANAALLADFQNVNPTSTNPDTKTFTYGERLFQAARFVTEMEYQHLVFEEFARKIQPAIRPFHVYHADINAAIPAEFAHAVYRFGHSMLDDVVARRDPSGENDLLLLDAFLNPPAYLGGLRPDGTTPYSYTPQQAAGAIVMGSSDQVGNELDEFVTETLRNNLLGLPLDLPTINMTRAREAGVPPLNQLRREINAATNDPQLAPYTSWSDFGNHLKHPESLINFVAAYGQHPSITNATTLAAKRAAAKAIVDPSSAPASDPTTIPADAADFMFSSGAWANDANGLSTTGLDLVDLWVGGLAEVTNLNGGLLGSTFNYVFQNTLENLQDGDRLYYLARTPGLNLRTQLEGNSFSELIQRNTDNTKSLKADAFATADCKFELANIVGPYDGSPTLSQSATPPLTPLAGAGSVNDDPATTDCDENQLLQKAPDGTVIYRQRNAIDPSGINGQSVYNGTDGVDKVKGGNDNDTVWGGPANDVIDAQGGDDVVLGGDGNDIVTDLDGADTLKGGPGNDALDGGPGDDIFMGGDGQDVINGGPNDNESFAGPGNDFVIAGQGADAVFGDGGDDWIEGGSGQDLLQGDHGAPFFDDPAQTAPGNEIFVGQVGENDYDAEGGDDLMSQNAAIDRNAGAGGFDWAFHQYNTTAADDDMMINNNLLGLPLPLVVNRDRWQETEADSGYNFDDHIKGTDGVLATPRLISGGGFTGCDALDQAGVARITGLAAILPPVDQWVGTAAETSALSATGFCPLTGPVWGEGDILLGGLGSDTIEGRAGDEIIDGDRYLTVAISVRGNPADPSTEIGRTDLLEHTATSGNFGPGTTGMTLQQAVFAGLVDPGNMVGVRQIITPTGADLTANGATNVDTAVFSGPLADYDLTPFGAGLKVAHTRGAATDGTDTLFNIEQLRFTDQTVSVASILTPTPTAGLSASSLTFASANTGTTSAAQTITVTNGGTANLVVSSVTLGGTDPTQFTVTNGCTAPVAPTGTCTISVTFKPTTAGAKTATVSIASNAPGSPTSVTVSGTATAAPAPIAGIAPTSLAFGNQANGTTSAAQTITVSNTGNANLVVSGVTVAGTNANQFSATAAAGCASVAPGGSCTISVRFAPTSAGAKTASVSIAHNAAGSPSSVAVTGTGTVPANPVAGISATSLAFGSQALNTTSAAQTITVTNNGGANLVVSAVTLGGTNANQFARTTTCATVAPAASCTISVTFRPTTVGAKTATISITHNAAGSPSVVTLGGTGVTAVSASMPTTLAFGTIKITNPSTKTLTVTNTGSAPLTISNVTTTGAAFSATRGTCTAAVAVGRTCKINVTFAPTSATAFSGSVTLVSNAATQPSAALSGTGR